MNASSCWPSWPCNGETNRGPSAVEPLPVSSFRWQSYDLPDLDPLTVQEQMPPGREGSCCGAHPAKNFDQRKNRQEI